MNSKKRTFRLILFFLLTCLSCHNYKPKQVLRIGIFHKLTPVNPFINDYSISSSVLDLVYDSLIRITPKGEIIPSIATSWYQENSPLAWIFVINDQIQFQDSSRVNADDVVYSLERSSKAKNMGFSNLFKNIQNVEKISDNKIKITLTQMDSTFWVALQASKIVPKKYFNTSENEKAFELHPIGSGPFKVETQTESEISLISNSKYFELEPRLKKIIIRSFQDEQAVLNQLISGNIDFIFMLSPQDYGALSKLPEIKIYKNWYPLLYSFMFNFKNPLFQERDIRTALNYALDKKRIIKDILNEQGFLSEGTQETISSLDPYKPEISKTLLLNKGWKLDTEDGILKKNNLKLEFNSTYLEGDEISRKTLNFFQDDLRKIGIKLNPKPISPSSFQNFIFNKRDFDSVILISVFRPFYQNEFGFFHSSQIKEGMNISAYNNPTLDKILEQYRSYPTLSENYQRMQKFLIEEKPALFLFWRQMPIVVHQKFKGIPPDRMETLRDLMYVYEE